MEETGEILLNNFNLAKYSFILKARNNLYLPPYKGSTLRGGFGATFRRICCVNKKEKSCGVCALKEKCAYAYIFETSPPLNSDKLSKLSDIPRPFVIEPPPEDKRVYRQGELLTFNLILIGKAIEYLPYFVFTFSELGDVGLGRSRGKYELSYVLGTSEQEIYDSKSDSIKITDSKIIFDTDFILRLSSTPELILSFLTPTRIKFKNDLVVKPEFHILLRSLLHRISALSYFHCGEEMELDYRHLISQAEDIRIKASNLEWRDWERYSSRQNTRMKLGGFSGEITYTGEFSPFSALLAIGQHTHVGKNCTFGLGKYEISGHSE